MNNLQVSFYTEAGSKRGMGHLIRCYTIYQKFKDMGIKSAFFLDSDVDYRYKFNDIEYFKWEEFAFDNEVNILFIDSYEADIELYNKISKCVKVPVYIDDYERLDYPRGLIINFAPDAKELFFKNRNKDSEYLLGLDYIPIRKEFLKYQNLKKEKKLFIMLGGNDTANLSLNIIEALRNIDIKKVIVTDNETTNNKLCIYDNIKVLLQPKDEELIKEMATSRYAISTASMSLYELSFLQIPTIIIAVSQNQVNGTLQLIQNNLAINCVDIIQSNWEENISLELRSLMKHNKILDKQIDGLGTKRLYTSIMQRIFK